MKKSLLFLIIATSINCFGLSKPDSLWNVIHSPDYSDSLKLEAYEVITKDLINVNNDSCRKICNEAIIFARSAKNTLFEWSFYNRIGITYYYESNLDKTIEYWIDGLKIAEAARDTFMISQTINNLAVAFDMLEEFPKAIKYYNRAIAFKSSSLAKLQQKIKTADDEKEKEKIEKEISNTLFAIGMQQTNIGLAYGKLNAYDSASFYLNESVKLLDQIRDKSNRFKLLTNIGTNYNYLGSHLDIKKFLYDALKYFLLAETEIENSDALGRTSWLINVGESYYWLNDEVKGYEYIKKAQQLANEKGLLEKQKYCYMVLRDYYLRSKDYKNAYHYHDSTAWIEDSLSVLSNEKNIAEIEAKYETEKKERENLELKQEVRVKEIENIKERRVRNVFIFSTAIFLVFIIVIIYLFNRLRHKNIELTTSKKELERLNQNLRVSKEETEKALEFKSLFLANMSHEIRTPLNIIIGFNSILKKKVSEPKLRKYLESIEMSSYNLLRFLNDILDMSKIEAGKIMLTPDTINLKLLIMNIRELFLLKAQEKKLELSVDIDPKMPQNIIIDEIRMRQILVNLIGNAIKFTEKGYVKILVDAPVLNKYQSDFSTKINVRIRVMDSGIGITAHDLEQIFESFRQVNTKEQKQMGGTGLGLAISKRLTEMMNGEISVESKKGEGSTFTVFFKDIPVGYGSDEKAGHKTNLSEELEYEFTGGKILVADDEEMNRSLIKVCFENTSVQIFEAANGEETIEMARTHHPDIIMMDIKMPGIDGLEATEIIKKDENLKNSKIIAFSASNIFDRLKEDEIKLFSGLISKPVLLDDLYEKVSEILPHQVKEKPATNTDHAGYAIDAFRDESMAEVLEKSGEIPEQLKQKWMHVYSTNSMNKILAFTNEIEEFAVKNNLNGLKNYALKIREAGKKFDIDQVKQLMKVFPELLEMVKS